MSYFVPAALYTHVGALFGTAALPAPTENTPAPSGQINISDIAASSSCSAPPVAVADTAEHKPDAPISGRRQRPGRSHLDEATKMRIVHLHGQGYTYRKIGKEIGRDHSVVSSVVSRWQREGTVKRARGSGRPRKTSPQIDKLIMSAVMADRSVNTTELKGNMDLKNLSKSTISRRIRESGEYLKMDASKVINYPDDRV